MNLLLRFLSLTLILIFSAQSSYAESVHEKQKLVDEIADLSGLEKQTLAIDDIVKQQAVAQSNGNPNLTPELKAKLQDVMIRELKSERILENTKESMLESYSLKELQSLVDFHKQERILKISRMEEAASTPEGVAKMQEFAQGLEKNRPSQQRIQSAARLNQAMKSTEFTLEIVLNIVKGLSMALESKEIPADQLAKLEARMRPQLEQGLLVQSLYVYKPLSQSELDAYTRDISTNKHLKKLHNIFIDELNAEFSRWGEQVGKELKKEMPKKGQS